MATNTYMNDQNNFANATLRLAPSVHLLIRNKTQFQLGLDPANAIQLPTGLKKIFEKCDGYTKVKDLVDMAKDLGFDEESVFSTLKLLVDRKLLIEATEDLGPLTKNQVSHLLDAQRATNSDPLAVQKRSNTRIDIVGAGRLGTTLALILGNSGFANLRIIDAKPVSPTDTSPWGASRLDVGLRRDYVAQTILERIHKGQLRTVRQKDTRSKPDLLIYAPDPAADFPWLEPGLVDLALAIDSPYLVMASGPLTSVVTSVLIPGKSSCVRCFHLNQTDRDPDWPKLVTQLIGKQIPDPTPIDLVMQTALFAYRQISRWLNEPIVPSNMWWQLNNQGEVNSAEIPPHQNCGCLWHLTKNDVA